MKFDAVLAVETQQMRAIAAQAQAAEALGFDGLWTVETQHNAFLPLALAAQQTSRVQLGTAVAIAFPRSPMVTAQIAWDLQALSEGRFILGLGTQVKAHIERRYGMHWEAPLPRLREYIQALRAIWHTWQTGERLNFRGRFYQHSLMTPFFNPGPISHPTIPIYIAGVNDGLARLAGELCDGFHVHPFHSVAYINQHLRPQIALGATQSQREPTAIALVSSVFVITGADAEQLTQMRESVRSQIAFYASTPSYRAVLEVHGWAEVGEQLSRLAAKQQWAAMSQLISDEMLQTFAVEAPLEQLGAALLDRYSGTLDRISLYLPFRPGEMDAAWQRLLATFHTPT